MPALHPRILGRDLLGAGEEARGGLAVAQADGGAAGADQRFEAARIGRQCAEIAAQFRARAAVERLHDRAGRQLRMLRLGHGVVRVLRKSRPPRKDDPRRRQHKAAAKPPHRR